MAKKLLSLLLACTLLTTLLPTQVALATESTDFSGQKEKYWKDIASWEDTTENASLFDIPASGNNLIVGEDGSIDGDGVHTVIIQPKETEDGVFDVVSSAQVMPFSSPLEDEYMALTTFEDAERYGVPDGSNETVKLFSASITSGNYTYTLSDNTATITGYTGSNSELSIPASIDGYPVIAIGTSAFEGNTTLVHVIVPEGITEIGETAFKNCTSLIGVDLPSTVATFKAGAFERCTSLASIKIPAALYSLYYYTSSHNGPFADCSSLKTATLEDGMTYVNSHLFAGCTGLETIVIPDSVTRIGNYAFYGCTSLTDAVISDNIASMGFKCFANCKNLTNINIPRSWSNCPSSSSSTVSADYCGHIFEGCSSLTEVTLPDGMTELPSYAFNYCDYLETINLPSTLTSIKNHAFYRCYRLKNISIPNGVSETIGKSAFCYCSALESVVIPSGVTELALYAFYGCTSLRSAFLPDSIRSIGYQCFANCSSLTNINIPQSWTECPSDNGTTIDSTHCGHIFQGCTSLTEITIPEGMEIPAFGLCYSDYLVTVHMPSTGTRISNHTFYGCSRLETIVVPQGVTSIGKSAFCYCSSLKNVTLPEGLTTLALYAFDGCSALESINLPDSIESIGWQCFADCGTLQQINLPLNWTKCPSTDGKSIDTSHCGHIFEGCKALTTLTVPDGLTIPSFGLCYSDYIETVNLPEDATEIRNHTFYGCANLKNINIADTISYIGKSAFNQCSSLEAFSIPSGIREVISYTFYQCSSLRTVNIPDTVENIYEHAFDGCKSLKEVDIPDSVIGVGYHAFANCNNLSDVKLSRNWNKCISSNSSYSGTSYQGGIFYGCTSLLSLTVPDGVLSLPSYAFSNCNNLKSVHLPDSLMTIPSYAFYGCSDLLLIQIPNGIIAISDYAFYNCTSIQMINLPDTIQDVGNYAFYNVKSTASVNYSGKESSWNSISFGQRGNTILVNAVPKYDYNLDSTFGLIRPTSLGNCFYSSPTEVSFSNFYGFVGAYSGTSHYGLIDVNDAFFGINAYDTAVSIPRDSFITLRFPKIVYFSSDSMLYIKTEGVVYEKADIYAVTESGDFQFICTAIEDSDDQLHMFPLKNLNTGIIGLKIVGKDLDGASPGFDVVDVYLIAHETAVEADYNSKTAVSITRNRQTHNLLKDEQEFEQGTEEYVTLMVTPDWQDHEPGYISITQHGKTILKNAGGTFVDVNPGALFTPIESVYVSLFDSNGNIVESLKLKLKINAKKASRLTVSTNEIALIVYENKHSSTSRTDDYRVSKGAIVTSAGIEYTTDEHGVVKIPAMANGSITVSKSGYITRTITAEQLDKTQDIYLQSVSDKGPVVSAVWIGNTDVLNQAYAVGLLSEQSTTLTAEVDWGSSSYGGIALMQDTRTVKFSGNSLTTVLKDNFDVTDKIYIVATDTAGNTTKKALKFESGSVSAIPNWLDGIKFGLGKSMSVTLPDSVNPSWLASQKIETGLSSIVPVTVAVDNGKVYAAIGVDFSLSRSDTWRTSTETGNRAHVLKTKTFIDKFKDTGILSNADNQSSLKKLKNLKSTFRQAIKYPQGKFGFDADFTVLGFAEGYYDSNASSILDVTWIDSGVILNPRVGVSVTYPLIIPLLNLEGGISADILAQFNLYLNEQAKQFMPDGSLTGTLALNLGLGCGLKKVFYGEGGAEGTLTALYRFNYDPNKDNYFKLSASGNWYAKVNLVFLTYTPKSNPWYDEVWVEYPQANAILNASLMNAREIYDASNYEVKDLSYLGNSSVFTANQASGEVMLMMADSNYLTGNTLKTNIYRESTPQYVQLSDGTKLAVWLDSTGNDINSIQLYYSYYNGTTWSDPSVVYSDGTLDNAPYLTVIDGAAYLVWQNATKAFSVSDSLESVAPYFDISVARFDVDSGFKTHIIPCDGLDMMPTICGNGERTYIVWNKNSENDWFSESGVDSIVYCTLINDTLSEVVTAYGSLNSVTGLAADYYRELRIAYAMADDTADVSHLYESGERVTTVDSVESSPAYLDHVLYWNSNGAIISSAAETQEDVTAVGNYQIIDIAGEKALVYTVSNGLASTLCVSYYNKETEQWAKPVDLTDGSTFIGAFSAAVSGDGTISVLYNAQSIIGDYTDDDPYGASTLSMVSLAPYCDLTMGELLYNADEYDAGNEMEFTFNLTNNGSQVISNIIVEVTDESNDTLSSIIIDDVIVPGQTITGKTYFAIDASATGQTIKITATPTDYSDVNVLDNSQTAILAFEDLSVENAVCGLTADNKFSISASIVNRGYTTRSNIVVELRKDRPDGTVIQSQTVTSLDALSLSVVSFSLSASSGDVYYVALKDTGDNFIANDNDFVTLTAIQTEFAEIDYITDTGAQLYLSNEKPGICIVAIYDNNGKMLTVGTKEVLTEAGEVEINYSRVALPDHYTAKVFLVDKSNFPIFKAVIREI